MNLEDTRFAKGAERALIDVLCEMALAPGRGPAPLVAAGAARRRAAAARWRITVVGDGSFDAIGWRGWRSGSTASGDGSVTHSMALAILGVGRERHPTSR